MATTKFNLPNRLYSVDAMLTSDAAAVITSSGTPGNADLATVLVSNVGNGATTTTFVISQLCLDGNFRNITTLSGAAAASVTVPTAVPGTNGQSVLISIPGPIMGLQVTLGGTSPTGQIYVEINLSEDRAQ